MGVFAGPEVVVDNGLVLSLDAGNLKSYRGSGTTWRDLSGSGSNGTLTNGPTYSSANGGSIVFDAIDDYIDTNRSIQFERTDRFSLSCWIYPTLNSNNQIINNEDLSYRGYFVNIATNGRALFSLRNTPTTNFIQVYGPSISTNSWYNIVATYNGNSNASGVLIYVNSVLDTNPEVIGNNLSATTISNQTTFIGARRPETKGQYKGNIAQVSIYNRALTAAEIQQNFNATRGRYGI